MKRFDRLFRPRRAEAELEDEVRAYFETRVEQAVARGLTREQAERAVRIDSGAGAEQVKQLSREARMGASIETAWQDLRFAGRLLAKSPGFTVFAVLTIALALGANAAIFSLVDGVLLKGAGYKDPERIVQLWEKQPRGQRNGIAPANYLDWTRQATSFEAMAAWGFGSRSYSGEGEPRSFRAGVVSARFFDIFGVKASLGRTFAPDEDQPGKGDVVVLTHRVWISVFGADPAIVGRSIQLDGLPHTVIGVLPGSSEFERRAMDLWVPLVFPPNPARDYHSYIAFARLKPGVSVEQAQAEMSTIAAGIARTYPVKKGWGATVDRYLDRIVGQQMRLSLQILMWAVVAVLLIGCVNLANLMMARGTLRSREISLRLALGAGRGRIVRMLLTESLLIGAGGAAVGVALGFGLLRWIEGLMPPFFLPAEARVAMDYRVMLFLAAVTFVTSIAFGFAPALDAARSQAAGSLHEGSRGNSVGKGKLYTRHVFVAVQVAAAFVLLVGAGLLIRSFSKIMNVDTGFASEGLIAGSLPIPADRHETSEQLAQYTDALLREILSSPGVKEAGIASALPLRGWGDGMPMWFPEKPDERLGTGFKIVTPGYLRALGIRLVAGRLLDERDTAGAPLVVVVNEAFARRHLRGQNAIGKRILVDRILPSRRDLGARAAWEIVGVVADEKARGLDAGDDTGAYASFLQNPVLGIGVVVRGHGSGTGALIKATQQAIWRVDKTQVFDDAKAVEEMKGESLRGRSLIVSLLGAFALLALVLAAAGIYGVLSFVTANRTREMGIRAAMGATRGDLIRLVAGGGAKPVFAGLAVGLAAAVGLGRFIETMLFDTRPADPLTLAAVGAVFLTVAMAACLIPALRASRAHPLAALRQD